MARAPMWSARPEVVIRRGEVLVEGGELVGRVGSGQFVKRARFQQLTPVAARV